MLDTDSWEREVLQNGELSSRLARFQTLISRVSDPDEIARLQETLDVEQRNHHEQLSNYINERTLKNNTKARNLELQRTNLFNDLTDLNTMLAEFHEMDLKASNIHRDISLADLECRVVDETVQFLRNVRTIKNNMSLVHASIAEGDLLVAARAINEIYAVPNSKRVLSSEFAKRVIPTSKFPEDPQLLLDQWNSKLTESFTLSFNQAARSQDVPELTKMFKLFPMLNKDDLGLDLYSKYVCDIIADESRKLLGQNDQSTTNKARSMFYADVLLHLFMIVSTIINDHSKIIAKSYGPQHMTHVMSNVQREVDLQCGLILDYFVESRQLLKLYQETREAKVENSSLPSVSEISAVNDEFSMILQNWSMYNKFFAVRWLEFSNAKTDTKSLAKPSPLMQSQFEKKLTDDGLLNMLQSLLFHNLKISFQNSMKLEELPSINELITIKKIKHSDENAYPISSVVEDMAILIRRNLVTAVNTGQFIILNEFLMLLVRFLQNEFLVKYMQNKFKDLQLKLSSSVSLKKYIPKIELENENGMQGSSEGRTYSNPDRAISPTFAAANTKLSQLGSKFNLRGAAANALTNIQSNLQSVMSDEVSVLNLHEFLIYLNTLHANTILTHRLLIDEIMNNDSSLLAENFPFQDSAMRIRERLTLCNEKVNKECGKLMNWALKYLYQTIYQGKVRMVISNCFQSNNEQSYIIGVEELDDLAQINDFVHKWNALVTPLENILYRKVFSDILSLMVDYIVDDMEARVWGLQANELGATKLDREFNIFVTTVCGMDYALKSKFTRISQIILIMGLDDEDLYLQDGAEINEDTQSILWLLTPQERDRARKLKVDARIK